MKKLNSIIRLSGLLLIGLLLQACATYTPYIQVNSLNGVPRGAKEMISKCNINALRETLKKQNIFIRNVIEGQGFETDEILIDKGTRAMYKVYDIGEGKIKVVPYWGITQAVKTNVALIAGTAAASGYETDDWYRVEYNQDAARPKTVFDYGYQLLKDAGAEDINFQ